MIIFTSVGFCGGWSPAVSLAIFLFAVGYDLRLSVRLTVPLRSSWCSPRLCSRTSRDIPLGGIPSGLGASVRRPLPLREESPAFFENLRQLLVRPLWIIGTLVARRGLPRRSGSGRPGE
jgi:hypothetical protein